MHRQNLDLSSPLQLTATARCLVGVHSCPVLLQKGKRSIANFKDVQEYVTTRYRRWHCTLRLVSCSATPFGLLKLFGLINSSNHLPTCSLATIATTSFNDLPMSSQLALVARTTLAVSPCGGISMILPFLPEVSSPLLISTNRLARCEQY